MFKEFEIFWKDLNKEAKERLLAEGFNYDDNMDDAPIAIFIQEEDGND